MRGPMWLGTKVLDDEWRTIYRVVRVKHYPGYPPPPQNEGSLWVLSTPEDS